MRFISEAESASVISHEMAYEAIAAALAAVGEPRTANFPVVLGHGSLDVNRFTVKAAATSELTGLKIGSYWPGNLDMGLPRHNSLILLFDQKLGRISVAIEAGLVNAYRTAAADAVAADLLARPDAEVLAIFGAGHQAFYECAAIARIRPLKRIMVVARDADKAGSLAAKLRSAGMPAKVADKKEACRASDIIVTATNSNEPLFETEWVRPGTHIASMGSDAIGKQELPVDLFPEGNLFCDLPEQSRRIGEFQHAGASATLTPLGDVIARRHLGRRSREEITIFDSSGLSVQDLYIAQHIVRALSR